MFFFNFQVSITALLQYFVCQKMSHSRGSSDDKCISSPRHFRSYRHSNSALSSVDMFVFKPYLALIVTPSPVSITFSEKYLSPPGDDKSYVLHATSNFPEVSSPFTSPGDDKFRVAKDKSKHKYEIKNYVN